MLTGMICVVMMMMLMFSVSTVNCDNSKKAILHSRMHLVGQHNKLGIIINSTRDDILCCYLIVLVKNPHLLLLGDISIGK